MSTHVPTQDPAPWLDAAEVKAQLGIHTWQWPEPATVASAESLIKDGGGVLPTVQVCDSFSSLVLLVSPARTDVQWVCISQSMPELLLPVSKRPLPSAPLTASTCCPGRGPSLGTFSVPSIIQKPKG